MTDHCPELSVHRLLTALFYLSVSFVFCRSLPRNRT
nr:MAG TPA: hypothetical protein [Caudoviricetes sp.]